MTEEFLIYLWNYRLINHNLTTTTGEEFKIHSTGIRNHDSGPDFFNALIEIGDTQWAGNVEMHINSSDWQKHFHQNDEAYDNIILHVVLVDDKPVYRKNSELIPTIELTGKFNPSILSNYRLFLGSGNSIPCHNILYQIKQFDRLSWFDSLMAERLEKKSEDIENLLGMTKNDLSHVFYQKLMRSFGYTANADAMELLASSLSLTLLLKHKNSLIQIEALLLGQSGLLPDNPAETYCSNLSKEYNFLKIKYGLTPMNSSIWKFMRMRPVSFPTIRISQFANIFFSTSGLLNRLLEIQRLQDAISLLSVSASPYWDNHYRFGIPAATKSKKLGLLSINIILINTIIPFLFVYGKTKNDFSLQEKALNWLAQIKPESNKITREFNSLGIKADNAMQSQALIQLKNNYCIKKRCLNCRFGHILLNRS